MALRLAYVLVPGRLGSLICDGYVVYLRMRVTLVQ